MKRATSYCMTLSVAVLLQTLAPAARAEGDWEITPESEAALGRGLKWLANNQGPEGNWTSNDVGLVAMGALAFLADGHSPGRGLYGKETQLALDYVVGKSKPSGLLNISAPNRGMYNHGLSTFVLGQAYGISNDPRMGGVMDRALKLICQTQCGDGGWDYVARPQPNGHDLSLAVMQAKALRGAVDSGLDVPPEVIRLAIKSVREHYTPKDCPRQAPDEEKMKHPGQFTYSKGGGNATVAMSAAGVVCLQEFGQYDDWRIEKNMEFITKSIREQWTPEGLKDGRVPFDAYTLYYVGQALYQVGGKHWRENYPLLRNGLVACQHNNAENSANVGLWTSKSPRVGGKPGQLYITSAACFILAMPNRYLPILQEGKIEALRERFQEK